MTTFERKTDQRLTPSPNRAAPTYRTTSEPVSLVQAVQKAVRETDEGSLRRVARPDAGLAFQPRTLLAMITFCYAKEIYGSEEIEDVMRRDLNFRQLCQNEFPDAHLIRRFRRANCQVIHLCVIAALHFLFEQKVADGTVTKINDVQVAEEARRRITMAMFIDSLELNGD
jgi:transposase